MIDLVDAFPKSKNLWVIKECPIVTHTAVFCGEPQADNWEFVTSAVDGELDPADLKKLKMALANYPGYKVDFYSKLNQINIVDIFDSKGNILNHTDLVAWCSENSLKLTKVVALEYNKGIPNIVFGTIASRHG